MKKCLLVFSLALIISPAFAQVKMEFKDISQKVLEILKAGEFEKVQSYLDSNVFERYSSGNLEKIWKNVTDLAGVYSKTDSVIEEHKANFIVVTQTMQFERKKIDLRLFFNKKYKIGNLTFAPHHSVELYKLPAYYDSTKVREETFPISSGKLVLPGVLSLPSRGKKKFPVVILIHGSGPNDRDESVGATKIFKDIALGLATKGIAVLRYDKRSKVNPSKSPERNSPTVNEETIDDVITAVNSLRAHPSIDSTRIYLLGHSLGAMLLPRISKRIPDVSGLIMISGNARPIEDLIYEQAVYLFSMDSMTERKKAVLDTLKKQTALIKLYSSSSVDSSKGTLLYRPKSYWIDLSSYNQVNVARELKMPIYILHGERDYQIPMTDYNLWKKELADKKNVQIKLYPKLNHMFQEGEKKSVPDDYDKQANVPQYVIDDLYIWIAGKK